MADTDLTTNEEVVDTSTNEELQDTDVALEDVEVSFDDFEDDEETEEANDSEDELTDTEPAESEEESEDDAEQTEGNEESEESSDEESKEENTPSEEDVKKHNAEMAQRRIAEKQARDAAKEKQQSAYLEEAEDARDLAVRQLQIDAYNNKVERNRNVLDSGIEKAVASIDLFRDGSPEIKEELARRLENFESLHVKYDQNGDPINVTGDVYDYLTKEADSIRRLINTGARKQSKAKSNAKTRTETLPTRAPKEPKVDPDLQAFDEEVAKWD